MIGYLNPIPLQIGSARTVALVDERRGDMMAERRCDDTEYVYVCSYDYAGNRYHLELHADSFGDAGSRLRAIGATGRCDGRWVYKHSLLKRTWQFVKSLFVEPS